MDGVNPCRGCLVGGDEFLGAGAECQGAYRRLSRLPADQCRRSSRCPACLGVGRGPRRRHRSWTTSKPFEGTRSASGVERGNAARPCSLRRGVAVSRANRKVRNSKPYDFEDDGDPHLAPLIAIAAQAYHGDYNVAPALGFSPEGQERRQAARCRTRRPRR